LLFLFLSVGPFHFSGQYLPVDSAIAKNYAPM